MDVHPKVRIVIGMPGRWKGGVAREVIGEVEGARVGDGTEGEDLTALAGYKGGIVKDGQLMSKFARRGERYASAILRNYTLRLRIVMALP